MYYKLLTDLHFNSMDNFLVVEHVEYFFTIINIAIDSIRQSPLTCASCTPWLYSYNKWCALHIRSQLPTTIG